MFKIKIRDLLYRLTGFYISRPPKKTPVKLKKIDFGDLVSTAIAVKNSSVNILQIGAYDGVSFDPIFDAVSNSRVKLFLIEPNSDVISRLQQTYSHKDDVSIINAAIVEADETDLVELYKFSEKLIGIYPDFGGTSSLSFKHLENAFERNRFRFSAEEKLDGNVVVDKIRALTAKQLLKELNITDVDVLVIDTEGADWIVLNGFLEAGLSPKLILFEHRFLLPHDYEAALMKLNSLNYLLRDLESDTLAIQSVL
ncbi:FkbM family methyltransferase [Desulfobacter latus]|uniref:FkbM family methyltransferase n=1 Tax=Desulfobacter latus TaxID=2292 RepID=A0A850TGS9_9BACT|nr:FkbM family methyltransferase [Desulfobacter latus]NWH06756.1 FkbM family methyltransferase [Desulfobacter latus]